VEESENDDGELIRCCSSMSVL